MDIAKIVLLLKNAGLQNIKVGNHFIEFDDPSCIYTAFDNILEFAWIVIVILTAMMLFGWAVLYIKNGIKINTVFNNAKTIILIFCVLSVVKPIVNLVYGDDLFSRGCARKRVSLTAVQELIDVRNKTLSGTDENSMYEVFDMTDSGIIRDTDADNVSIYTLNDYDEDYFVESSNHVSETNQTKQNNQSSGKTFVKVTYSHLVTIYIDANGNKVKRSGGSAAWRNNNPGNIRKSKNSRKLGAIGETDKWAVFPTEEAGLNAIIKLLRSKSYRNLSIKAAIHRWAPFSDGNNPESYSRKVSKMTGLPADAKIRTLNDKEMRKVANAIKVIEGWDVGKEEKI